MYSTGIYNKEDVKIVTKIVKDVQGLHYKNVIMIVVRYSTGIFKKETVLIVTNIVQDVQGLH